MASEPEAATAQQTPETSVKETVTSIIIAFALAFVFRGFVIEAFLIPTGSMAPTLRGAHMQFKSPQTGYEWAVTPDPFQGDPQSPNPVQKGITVHDPMTLFEQNSVTQQGYKISGDFARSWGDRIFVMKYLYSIYDPERFDVVVFKNPRDPTVNYIKRLIGLPNQMVALIDGDVFSRPIKDGDLDLQGRPTTANPWALADWKVARKPERAQRAMWQIVFSSEYTPLKASRDGVRWFDAPWVPGVAKDWQVQDRREYAYAGSGPAVLAWDDLNHPIGDAYAYNEMYPGGRSVMQGKFPVSDVRLSLGIRPQAAGEGVAAVVVSRHHEFRAEIAADGAVTLKMRPVEPADQPWQNIGSGSVGGGLPVGQVTNVDFWHVDQSMKLYVNDRLVAQGVYDWTPEERVRNATGLSLEQVMQSGRALESAAYTRPKARFEFSGGAFTLYRVSLSRDIYYESAIYPAENDARPRQAHSKAGLPAFGTHPSSTIVLNKDQFFVCGDNSPQSLDARLWDLPSPWVQEIDPDIGVVDRELLIGKAFFVYFPAPFRNGFLPIPDFGSMRFIW